MHILFYNYKSWVEKVESSSLIDVKVNLGFRIEMSMRIKLCGFQSPEPELEPLAKECLEGIVLGKRVIVSPWRPPMKGGLVLCNVYCSIENPVLEFSEAIESVGYDHSPVRYYLDVSSYMNLCSRYGFRFAVIEDKVKQLGIKNIV
jgi:hypothetical protein